MKSSLGCGVLAAIAVAIAASAGPLHAELPDDSWKAGAAQVKITPEKPMWATGFGNRIHPSSGGTLDLWAKALALEDPRGHHAVLITLDLCGITRAISDRVAAELEERRHIPRRSVVVNVSHDHSGPVVEGYLVGEREYSDQDWRQIVSYRQELELRMIRVAEEALDRLAPATLSWDVDSADIGVNRRNNVENDVPALRAAGRLRGPVDDDVPILAVRSADGNLAAIMVSYSCHNTTLHGYEWSGDYAGYAQADVERAHPGTVALFMQGCGGNINPLPRGETAEAEDYGGRLAAAVDRGLAKTMHPVRGDFDSSMEDIPLSLSALPNREDLERASEHGSKDERIWARYLLGQLKESGGFKTTYSYPVQAWRLGDLSFIVLGGEVMVDYELRLQRECRSPVWVFGYSNDVMSYIPTDAILAEDAAGAHVEGTRMGFEGRASMMEYGRPSPWAPGLEEKIVAAAHREFDRVQKDPLLLARK